MHLYQMEIKLLKAAALWRLGRNGSVFLSLGKPGTDSKRQYQGWTIAELFPQPLWLTYTLGNLMINHEQTLRSYLKAYSKLPSDFCSAFLNFLTLFPIYFTEQFILLCQNNLDFSFRLFCKLYQNNKQIIDPLNQCHSH